GLAELTPLLGILYGSLISSLGNAEGQCSYRDPSAVQYLHGLFKAISNIADPVGIRDTAIVEYHFCRFAGPHAQLVFFLTSGKSRRSPFHDKGRSVIFRSRLAGP